jgi:membrane protein DedA with SNARE-associated domain
LIIPTDLSSFLELIRQNGDTAYALMFAYASGHSLLLAMFAGYAAHAGALSLGPLIAVCWIGSFFGDVVRFWIGRKFGIDWLKSYPRLLTAMRTAVQLANRHHIWMILLHRYPHGIRGVAGFAYGISPLPWPTFLVLNFIAAGIWAGAVVSTGYAFGKISEKAMTQASSSLGAIMLIAFLALSWFLSKRLERVLERS